MAIVVALVAIGFGLPARGIRHPRGSVVVPPRWGAATLFRMPDSGATVWQLANPRPQIMRTKRHSFG